MPNTLPSPADNSPDFTKENAFKLGNNIRLVIFIQCCAYGGSYPSVMNIPRKNDHSGGL